MNWYSRSWHLSRASTVRVSLPISCLANITDIFSQNFIKAFGKLKIRKARH